MSEPSVKPRRRRKKKRLRNKKLGVSIPKTDEIPSYVVDAQTFRHLGGKISINSKGIKHDNNLYRDDDRKGFRIRSLDELDQNQLEVLGRGNTGIVVKARHVPTNKDVAIKKMTVYQRDNRHQLLKEIKTLYQANCPQLVDFYGAYYKDGTISIALEYMDAGSLQHVMSTYGKIPEPTVAAIAMQVLKGLSYLHTHAHKVHRDIKPSNLCVNYRGHVKITDFGISADLQNSIAVCDTFVGTCNYMSPERIKGDPYSWPGDIWGAGLCLLECALGRFPYPDSGVFVELVTAIVHSPIPDFSDENLSEHFLDFVLRCLNKDPAERPSADELLEHEWLKINVPKDEVVQLEEWFHEVAPEKFVDTEDKEVEKESSSSSNSSKVV